MFINHELAVWFDHFRFISAKEEFSFEQLDSYDGEYELEQHVDDHDVDYVLQRVDHAFKDGLDVEHDYSELCHSYNIYVQ